MLKSILLISVFSLFISSTVYLPTAKAGFLKDAIKDKLRKEARRKLRKEEDRARRRSSDRRDSHREGRRDSHREGRRDSHREGRRDSHRNGRKDDRRDDRRERQGHNAINVAVKKMRRAQRNCTSYYREQTWKQEYYCFRSDIREIISSINNDLRHKRISHRAYNTLSSMNNRLSGTLGKCREKNTWRNAALCFERRLEKIANSH